MHLMIWSSLFVTHVTQFIPQVIWAHLIMSRRGKNHETELRHHPAEGYTQGVLSYRSHTSVSGAEGHGCWPLYVWNWEKISTIWEKQIKRETGLGFALPCTRSVSILFYFIVGLLFIYLFFYLSIYFFFHSPFMNSGLGSEGNHIVTSHLHPNFPVVPPGLLGGGACSGKLKIITNVWIFSIFYYTVEYIFKYPCALEDEWEAVKMDEYVFQMKFCIESCWKITIIKSMSFYLIIFR